MGQVLGKAARAKGWVGAEEAAEALGEGGEGGDGASAGAFNLGGGDAANKAAAIRALGEIAAWFKRVEPHSPVSFLLERAVLWSDTPLDQSLAEVGPDRSAERRVGKECVSTFRSRWLPSHIKQNNINNTTTTPA